MQNLDENLTTPRPSIWSVGLKFGVILTAVSLALMLIRIILNDNPFQSDWKQWLGSVITIGVVVWAHISFKDTGDGYMSYGQGLGLTIVVVLVSTLLGGLVSYLYINLVDPDMLEEVWRKTADDMEEKGSSEEQIQMALEWTKKLFWVFYLIGGVVMGFIMGLIISIFTQKSRPETSI